MSYKNITTQTLGKNRHAVTLWTDDGVEQYEFQNYAYEKCYPNEATHTRFKRRTTT
jgi:hypothetical protein